MFSHYIEGKDDNYNGFNTMKHYMITKQMQRGDKLDSIVDE